MSLANLFTHTARSVPPGAEGANRARSATEAFLFRRLETLSETTGRFRLNAKLPIAFDGWGRMEVDLLCADARVVVELDGRQHLADADAYRRDRRKNALLQENGYFVLRYLAEDVGKALRLSSGWDPAVVDASAGRQASQESGGNAIVAITHAIRGGRRRARNAMITGTFTGTPPEFLVLVCPLVYPGVTMCPASNGDAVKMWC